MVTECNKGVLFKDNTLWAYNFEIGAKINLDCDSSDEFIIPPKAIDMIEQLVGEEIEIIQKDTKITVKSSKGRSSFATVPAKEFAWPKTVMDDRDVQSLDANEVCEAIEKVIYACREDLENEYLRGVRIESDGDRLNFVATDGVKFAMCQTQNVNKLNVTIPKSALIKLLSFKPKGDLVLSATKNNAVFKSDDYEIYTPLISGDKFVNYKRVIEQFFDGNSHKVEIDRLSLLTCLQRSLICDGDKLKTPVVLACAGDTVNVSTRSVIAEFSESVTVGTRFPADIEIAMQPSVLLETLRAFDDDTLELYYTTALKPILISNGGLKAIAVPCRRN